MKGKKRQKKQVSQNVDEESFEENSDKSHEVGENKIRKMNSHNKTSESIEI